MELPVAAATSLLAAECFKFTAACTQIIRVSVQPDSENLKQVESTSFIMIVVEKKT